MRAGLRAKVSIGALVLGLALALPASAQQSADQVVLDLNHGAMEAYNNMDINKAGSMLEEALRVATEAGVGGPVLAQTNMNLAIVYVGGLGDNDSGVRYFADALCADPSSQLDPLTSTPDIQSVFQVAAQRVQQSGCGGGGGRPNVGPGAAAQTMPMGGGGGGGYAPSGGADEELPPGWNATKADDDGKAKDFKRGFVQLGFTIGMPYVTNGMLADRAPPLDRIFIHAANGGKVADPYATAMMDPNVLRFPGTQIGVPDATGQDIGLAQANAWVPDADSSDGYTAPGGGPVAYIPLGGSCPADGTETGPPLMGMSDPNPRPLLPSRYCVRVKSPGFATQLAMRAAVGYFVTRDFSVSLLTRFQFSAGQGTFAHMLLGGRLEYMFTKTKARGLMVSGFLGGTFGQIQAQPSADKPVGGEPWIKSGLQGAHIGSNIRYRFTDSIGMFMAPEPAVDGIPAREWEGLVRTLRASVLRALGHSVNWKGDRGDWRQVK